jgi:hypothetical protein
MFKYPLKDQPLFRHLDLKGIDYHLYQCRSRELRMEDRGRRLILHKFIAQNMESLFRKARSRHATSKGETSCSTLLPPIETFALKQVSREERVRLFFVLCREADLLYCSVSAKNTSGLLLTVVCFAPETGKARTVFDLGIKCFCPAAEMVSGDDGRMFIQESFTATSLAGATLQCRLPKCRKKQC